MQSSIKEMQQRAEESQYADRDPILKHIYNEVVKIRKWVVFIGVVMIISIIGAVLSFL